MKRYLHRLGWAAALFVSLSGASNAQILNGSFETPVIPTFNLAGIGLLPGTQVYSAGTGITNWTTSGGNVTLVDAGPSITSLVGLFTPEAGNQYAVLGGLGINVLGVPVASGTAGTLKQTLTTVTGKSYQVSFYYSGLSVGVLSSNTALDVGVTNATGVTAPAAGLLAVTLGSGWQQETFQFTATGSSSVLSFAQDPSGVNLGLISLDNVSLTALPEPMQYGEAAILFLGLLVLARIARQQMAHGPGDKSPRPA